MEGLKDEEKDNSTVYGSTYDFLCICGICTGKY